MAGQEGDGRGAVPGQERVGLTGKELGLVKVVRRETKQKQGLDGLPVVEETEWTYGPVDREDDAE